MTALGASPLLLALALGAGCSDDPVEPALEPRFPSDYAASYTEVRDCRKSGDHELDFVRVLADPSALEPYRERAEPFPEGSVLLKEQYDVSDTTCSGPIVAWTVMVKDSAAGDRLGWDWQRVGAARRVVEQNGERCVGCHSACTGAPAGGYDYSCEDP